MRKRAVARIVVELQGKPVAAELVKGLDGDGHIYHKGTLVPIRKATTKEVDMIQVWRPW